MTEETSTDAQPKDLLNDLSVVGNALLQIAQFNLPSNAFTFLAALAHYPNPSTIVSAESFARAGHDRLYNPKTEFMFEKNARNIILGEISKRVINGTEDMVICETDMNNLKGLNDKFGELEADKAILVYARWIRMQLDEISKESGKEINYAFVNVDGEGSDSMKVAFFGSNLYQFSRDFINQVSTGHAQVELKTKIQNELETPEITGGWGFYVMKNEDAKKLTQGLSEEQKPGILYVASSQVAKDRMLGSKSFNEANLINQILNVEQISELSALEEQINEFGERIPKVILDYYFSKKKELTEKSS